MVGYWLTYVLAGTLALTLSCGRHGFERCSHPQPANTVLVQRVEDKCRWRCAPGYDDIDGACIDTQYVPCLDASPANATSQDLWSRITFDEATGWSTPAVCPWTCDVTFCREGNQCNSGLIDIRHENATGTVWFGGDDRGASRNLGGGQRLVIPEETQLESFALSFSSRFDYDRSPEGGHEVTLVLHLREDDGTILTSSQVVLPPSYNGGWVAWTIGYVLGAGQTYIFTAKLHDGYNLQYSTGSEADFDQTFPDGQGVQGEIFAASDSLDDWQHWNNHPTDRRFRLTGTRVCPR